MATRYNVNLIGSLTNTNGVLSGFSANSNYATFSGDTFNDTDVEIVFKTKFNRVTGNDQMCYTFYDSTKTYSLCAIGLTGGKFYFEITNGSASLGDISGTTTVAINTDYYIKAVRDNTTYTLYSSTNGTNWTTEGTLSNITFPSYTSATNYIGGYAYNDNGFAIDQILDGTIDLNESYIKVGGQYFWRGVTNTTTIQLRRDTASNWSTVNPILAEGEVGIDISNNYIKVGNGSTAWNSLPYATIPPEILQTVLNDKVDCFEVDSPLTDTWKVNSNAELSTNASVSNSGILSDTDYGDYWAVNNTTIDDYIDNQMSYWKVHFKFKTSSNSEIQPFFGLADGAGEYDTNFIELYITNGYFATNDTTTNVSIPTNTWVEVDIEHIEGASNVSATINIEGTISTVSNVLNNNYTLSSAKGVEWFALGVTPFESDITWNGFYIQNAPYSAKYCILTDRYLGVDSKAFDGQWVSSSQTIISSATSLNGNTNLTYTVQVPNDGHVYEVLLKGEVETGSSSGNFCVLSIQSNQLKSDWCYVAGARTRTSSGNNGYGSIIIPIKRANNNLTVRRSSNYQGSVPANGLVMLAYRRVGTNS